MTDEQTPTGDRPISPPPAGDPEWWKGTGLYVEIGPLEAHFLDQPEGTTLLFAPLPDDVFNVERWVRDQFAEWGYPAPGTDVITEIVRSLQAEQAHPASTIKREKFDITRARPAEWLWESRVYLGGFNILLGREGVGKGTLACWLVTQLALGRLAGKFHGAPANVAIIGSEDDFHSVWGPRVIAAALEAGLNMAQAERLFDGQVFRYKNADGGVPNLSDARDLARAVHEDEIKLVYFDSLMDSLPPGCDPWKDQKAREGLLPAKWLAEELDIAVVGSLHPNKRGETFDQIVSGARSFNAVSRSSLLLEDHPKIDGSKVVLRAKGNYGEKPRPLEWQLVGRTFRLNDHDFNEPVVHSMEDSDVTEEDLMARFAGGAAGQKEPTKIARAITFMQHALADGEWHQAATLIAELEAAGVKSKDTIYNARLLAGVETMQTAVGHAWRMTPGSESS